MILTSDDEYPEVVMKKTGEEHFKTSLQNHVEMDELFAEF